ncbi:DUF2510 domain-containing protein [Streptomyces sp. JH14]|uniref:DUF2510 domain-containing protein n=1 Tax=Streptomyces sp. JH14 TaxID=2793630 RepID=UPI0023F93DA7|nr:DUF2510 domain-containing protein [Streptomyces sp. JH14]MDF6045734.1 DUF2510 domain-containing protein [Streptomyces sp. JH14]
MTEMSPPGWHTDPGYTGTGPVQERWWDGSQWTDQLRMPPAAVRRRRVRIGVGVTAGVVVLAAIAGGVLLLTDDSGGSKNAASDVVSPTPGAPGGRQGEGGRDGSGGGGRSPAPDQQQPLQPPAEDGYVTDMISGVSLPVPDGWKGQSAAVGASVSTGTYACPADATQKCERGGVFAAPAQALKNTAKTAEAAAKADIAVNAKESYGGKAYGAITSHQQLKSEPVTVAGQKGYVVRWKVVTKSGDDGYVQSLVLPSPHSADMLVVVRSGFDISPKAPALSVMDEITKGIKASSGGGSEAGQTA